METGEVCVLQPPEDIVTERTTINEGRINETFEEMDHHQHHQTKEEEVEVEEEAPLTLAPREMVLPAAKHVPVFEVYDIEDVLGSGAFSTVFAAVHKETDYMYAIKHIKKYEATELFSWEQEEQLIKREVRALSLVQGCPKVLELIELYEDDDDIFLVLELIPGGELFERIVTGVLFEEAEARSLIHSIVVAIDWCHQKDVVHRDIKPENLLCGMEDFTDPSDIKLGDFGLAIVLPLGETCTEQAGSPGYVAPEILLGLPYDRAIDMWSLGVTAYVVLAGFPPWDEECDKPVADQIIEGAYEFPDPEWTNISREAKDFVMRCMTLDPLRRITAKQALTHPFLLGTPLETYVDENIELEQKLLERLQQEKLEQEEQERRECEEQERREREEQEREEERQRQREREEQERREREERELYERLQKEREEKERRRKEEKAERERRRRATQEEEERKEREERERIEQLERERKEREERERKEREERERKEREERERKEREERERKEREDRERKEREDREKIERLEREKKETELHQIEEKQSQHLQVKAYANSDSVTITPRQRLVSFERASLVARASSLKYLQEKKDQFDPHFADDVHLLPSNENSENDTGSNDSSNKITDSASSIPISRRKSLHINQSTVRRTKNHKRDNSNSSDGGDHSAALAAYLQQQEAENIDDDKDDSGQGLVTGQEGELPPRRRRLASKRGVLVDFLKDAAPDVVITPSPSSALPDNATTAPSTRTISAKTSPSMPRASRSSPALSHTTSMPLIEPTATPTLPPAISSPQIIAITPPVTNPTSTNPLPPTSTPPPSITNTPTTLTTSTTTTPNSSPSRSRTQPPKPNSPKPPKSPPPSALDFSKPISHPVVKNTEKQLLIPSAPSSPSLSKRSPRSSSPPASNPLYNQNNNSSKNNNHKGNVVEGKNYGKVKGEEEEEEGRCSCVLF